MNDIVQEIPKAVMDGITKAMKSLDPAKALDTHELADLLGCSYTQVAIYTSQPDFPKPIIVPNLRGGKTIPKWVRRHVLEWQDRVVGWTEKGQEPREAL